MKSTTLGWMQFPRQPGDVFKFRRIRAAPLIKDENDFMFQVVSNLTYHRMAMHEGVDTHTLRKALWNYIHCLYGIRSVPHAPEITPLNTVARCFSPCWVANVPFPFARTVMMITTTAASTCCWSALWRCLSKPWPAILSRPPLASTSPSGGTSDTLKRCFLLSAQTEVSCATRVL